MSDALDNFESLTADIAARLSDYAGFAAATPVIPVLTERLSDLKEQMEAGLTIRGGLAIVVATPEFGVGDQPEIILPRVPIHIYENVQQNQGPSGSKLTALKAAWTVYFSLLRFEPEGWSALLPAEGQPPVRLIGSGQAELAGGGRIQNLITYEVSLSTWAHFSPTAEPEAS